MVLDNIKLTNKRSITFIPIEVNGTLCHFLHEEHPEIDYDIIHAIKIKRNPELNAKYSKYQEQCQKVFTQYGYNPEISADHYEAFISNIDPEWLFERICTFWKPDINPIAYEYMRRSYGSGINAENTVLPTIWRNRFDIIGNANQCNRLEILIDNCNLSNDDLELILHTLKLKTE